MKFLDNSTEDYEVATVLKREEGGWVMENKQYKPWHYLVLKTLERLDGKANLKSMYSDMEVWWDDRHDSANEDLFDPELFGPEPSWEGERPKYRRIIRKEFTLLVKDGLVDRVARGVYQISDNGYDFLQGKDWH